MPSFKDPGTESLAGEGSSHKLLPLCADTHGRLHSLMTLPTGRDLPRGFWDQASESQGFLALITARKQTAHCPLSPGLRESVRNPVHILGRVLSGMILEGRERKMKAGPASSCLPGKLTLLEPCKVLILETMK